MPRKDYIPDSAQNLVNWTNNYLLEVDAIAVRIGWPAAQVTALKARLTTLRDAAQEVLDKQNDLDTATGHLVAKKDAEVPEIRRDTNNLKSTRGFTDGDARTLDVLTASGEFDPDGYKPPLSAVSKQGRVEITAKKNGVDAVNLYSRIKGQAAFKLLAAKRSRFPFDDTTAPATAGQPEEREYQAIGVLGDDEIGQPSDIVSAVFRPA
jgi:hypothetical protein